MDRTRLSFTLYRVLAYATGIALILLTFAAMPAKYMVGENSALALIPAPAGTEALFGPDSALMLWTAIPHGYIYMAYVLVVIWLSLQRRWSAAKTLGVALAGTIPFLGLVIEHRMAKAEKAAIEKERAGAPAAAS